jgi:hypothetical protein
MLFAGSGWDGMHFILLVKRWKCKRKKKENSNAF